MNITKLLLLIGIITIISSCNDKGLNSLEVGEEYINNEASISFRSYNEIKTGTVLLNSIITSDTQSALIGNINNKELGNVKSKAVFMLNVAPNVFSGEKQIYDSITIKYYYNKYSVGDTTVNFSFKVKELKTKLSSLYKESKENNSPLFFYNITKIETAKDTLCEATINSPKPDSDNSKQESRMSDVFGQKLFNLYFNKDDKVKNNTNFQEYFKGLVVEGDDENKAMLGFLINDTSMCVNLYYHKEGSDKKTKSLTFTPAQKTYKFNSIIADRSTTLFSKLENKDKIQRVTLNSTETNNLSAIQSGTGLYSKMEFTNIPEIMADIDANKVLSAKLILHPTDKLNNSKDNKFLYKYIYIYTTNYKNEFNNDNLLKISRREPLSLELIENKDNAESDYHYETDITNYIRSAMSKGLFNENYPALLLGFNPELNTTVSTLMLHGQDSKDFKPELKIYYYDYK